MAAQIGLDAAMIKLSMTQTWQMKNIGPLVSSREGVDITKDEALKIAEIIKPLLEQGQSPYQIVKNHPELGICEKTLYNYVTGRVFALAGIADIDLRCKVSRRLPRKLIKQYKKREDRSYLVGTPIHGLFSLYRAKRHSECR